MPPLKGIEAVAAKAAYGLYTFTGDLFFFNIEMRHSTCCTALPVRKVLAFLWMDVS